MTGTTRSDAGFTLFEAIAALVIVAVGIAALCQAIGGAYRTMAGLKSRTALLISARSQLDAAGIALPLAPGTSSGTYPNGSSWRMTVTTIGKDPDAPPEQASIRRAYWVALEVWDRRGQALFELETAKVEGAMP